MKLVYGMCGLGLAQAVAMASAMGTNQVSAVEHRELQDVQMGLCGSSTSGDGSSVANFCAFPSQQIASQTTWSPCCLSDTNPTKDIVCRTFTVDGAYCSDSPSDCDAALTTQQASWDFQISWNAIPGGEQCCKTCTCFGDPECVAFNGTKNLWIPCDARVVNGAGWCPMWEYRCNEISSENTGGCTWIGGSLTTTQGANSGWDIATQGSPCVPTLPVDQLTMNMYSAGSFDATLGMGERGVIKALDLTMGSIQAKMDADGCFATGTLADWTGTNIPTTLPDGWYVEAPAGDPSTWEVVKWHVYDSTNNIAVDFACVRAIKNGVIGGARINVNAITAPTSLTGSGFCESTTIPEAGDNSGSSALHAQCVQDRPTSPLQACKHLVAMGASETEVEECANQFCATAQLSGAERTSCTSELGGNSGDYKQWRKWYCIAIANQGTFSSSQCQATVNRDGWNTATETMGRGIEDQDVPIGSVSCSANLADYAVQPGASENECRQGAFMQFNQSGVWVDAYFFPATCGPLSFSIAYSSANAKFFTESYRLIQCDPQTKEVCRALGKCEDVAGAIFSIDYSTVASSVIDALNNGGLVCIPLNDGSGKYSCSNTTPNAPTTELCPCENCNQNRRLLEVAGAN